MSGPTAGNASSEPAPDEHDANTRPRQRRRVNDGSGGEEGGGDAVGSGDDARPDPAPRNDQDGGSNQGGGINQGGGGHQGRRTGDTPSPGEVKDFRDRCLARLRELQEPEPKRAKLLKLLCRRPPDSRKPLQRNLPLLGDPARTLELDSSPHCNDDDGELAKLANRIRLAEHDGILTDDAVLALRNIPGWTDDSKEYAPWGIGDMCFCETCGIPRNRYTFIYRERLERSKLWYTPNDEPQLIELIEKHWTTFFYKIQQLPFDHIDSNGNRPWLEEHAGIRLKMSQVPIDPSAKQELWDDEYGLKEEAYRAIALLNDCRRNYDQVSQRVIDSLNGLEPKFNNWKHLNFEGTEEDHYCLGSRYTGFKYYVGVTNDKHRRHAQHAGLEGDRGAYYIKYMTRRCSEFPDRFGGWKLSYLHGRDHNEAFQVKNEETYSTADEDKEVIEQCCSHGMFHVRGGVHVFPELSEEEKKELLKHHRAHHNLCNVCGVYGHRANKCPNGGQPANEDPALSAHMGLLVGSDKDERKDDPFERASIVVGAVCENLPVSRIVCMSNSAETNPETAEDNLGDLVDALYGDGERNNLRPLQTQAMRHVFDQIRPDITLTVPTAYGKTRVYTVAAVHEVIYGAGRAVIFLPYSALMSDIASELSKRSDSVVEYEADDRVRGAKMPYGGILQVKLKNNKGREVCHSIIWTIWRGYSGDEHMKMHTSHWSFRRAQIILATPDKWAYPDPGKNNDGMPRLCDSFIRGWGHDADSRKKWISELGLVVIDEAHEFKEVLGGQTRELLRRMRTLRDFVNKERTSSALPTQRQRVMLVSATIPRADKFSEDLLGRPGAKLVRPDGNTGGSPSFLFEPQKKGSNNEEPSDYKDLSLVDRKDAEELVAKLKNMGNHRHRVLLLMEGKIKLRVVPDDILSPDVLGAGLQEKNALVRRVLIFLDSKAMSAQLVRLLKSPKFVDAWKTANNVKVTVTPYHGDVARMHRRVYEGMMKHFVKEPSESSEPPEQPEPQHLHIIVATSALEAGVNVRGIDVVIILDTSRCSRESLLQRIGRAGRVAGTPAVCIIGVLEDDEDDEDDDQGTDEEMLDEPDGSDDDDEEAAAHRDTTAQPNLMRDPVAYLRPQETAVSLADSRAMKLHSARQLMRNMKELKFSVEDQQEAINTIIGFPPNAPVNCDNLDEELHNEITARDTQPSGGDGYLSKSMSMRGSNSGAVSIRLCNRVTEIAGDAQIRGVARRRGRGKPFVELARIDALKCFDQAHWRAHFQDPHGGVFKVVDFRFRGAGVVDASKGCWLQRLEAVHVVKPDPTKDIRPHHLTRGDTIVCRKLIEPLDGDGVADALHFDRQSLRIGTVLITHKWEGFSYINPFNGENVGDYHKASDPLGWQPPFEEVNPQKLHFFQPAKFRCSGWEWQIQKPLPPDLEKVFAGEDGKGARKNLSDELTLHICKKLGCGRQDLRVEFVTDDHPYECACNGAVKVHRSHPPTNPRPLPRLLVYESSATGLAKESLRRIARGFVTEDMLNRDAAAAVLECVNWLHEQWAAGRGT